MSRLTDLLARAAETDPLLARDLADEFAHRTKRQFGLVYETHLPEWTALPTAAVVRGATVTHDTLPGFFTVRRVDKDTATATLAPLDGGAPIPAPTRELTVHTRFGDDLFPGLVQTGEVSTGDKENPAHAVITAENEHALRLLRYTHRATVDCIYIDPPYNTGNKDWIYNDAYVESADDFRHSKWLAFMERRLTLAKDLLAEHGVIIVAIGDQEMHRLRMLMEQVFGIGNYLQTLVWDSPGSNSGKTAAGGVDYMLVFARNAATHFASLPQGKWAEPRAGQEEMLALVEQVRADGGTPEQAQKKLRAWIKREQSRLAPGTVPYSHVDAQWRVYQPGSLTGPGVRLGLDYPITDPATGKVYLCDPDSDQPRWRWSREKMDAAIAAGDIEFKEVPRQKLYLANQEQSVPRSVFEKRRSAGSKHLETVLGDRRFPFPKDHQVLARWIGVVTGWNPDAVVLDFFGGSGTTAEAVMRLNQQDGGRRRCVLVTNNEVAADKAKELRKAGHRPGDPEWERWGVAQYVTVPRLSTVASGTRPDGSTYPDSAPATVRFFTLTYEGRNAVRRNMRYTKIAPALWLRAGQRGPVLDTLGSRGWACSSVYGVIADLDRLAEFTARAGELGTPLVFVVTDDSAAFTATCARLGPGVTAHQLYEDYLANIKINEKG